MENKQPTEISYYAHEAEVARLERHNKRAFLLTLIIFFALIVTNVCWIVYENSYVDSITVTQDTPNGNNNYVGHNGDIINGTPNYNQSSE